jgi:pyrroloquinoline quinone biosynthesis protein B
VRRGLEDRNAMMRTLHRFAGQVTWRQLDLNRETAVGEGLFIEARAARGKVPVHLEGLSPSSPEDNVSLWIREAATGKRAAYLGATSAADGLQDLHGVECIFFDGTFWSSDELQKLGLSKARAEDMAHLPIGGAGGSLERLGHVAAAHKIYTHINNSNPILVEGSPEEQAVREAGWQIAFDGMEVAL